MLSFVREGLRDKTKLFQSLRKVKNTCLFVCLFTVCKKFSRLNRGFSRSYKRLPLRPPFLRVLSVGIGVTSSILPIFNPERERALSAD